MSLSFFLGWQGHVIFIEVLFQIAFFMTGNRESNPFKNSFVSYNGQYIRCLGFT